MYFQTLSVTANDFVFTLESYNFEETAASKSTRFTGAISNNFNKISISFVACCAPGHVVDCGYCACTEHTGDLSLLHFANKPYRRMNKGRAV